jgi:hypothetical protein
MRTGFTAKRGAFRALHDEEGRPYQLPLPLAFSQPRS